MAIFDSNPFPHTFLSLLSENLCKTFMMLKLRVNPTFLAEGDGDDAEFVSLPPRVGD